MSFSGLHTRDGLMAPESYWNASEELRARNCNGCGTEGWLGLLVPDTIYCLRISHVCNVHDWMYATGTTKADKMLADAVFLQNLIRLIALAKDASVWNWTGAPWLLQLLRERRAFSYYQAVYHSSLGLAAFKAARLQ